MKLSDLKEGQQVWVDEGFTCAPVGRVTVKFDGCSRPFFECEEGEHYFDGQVDFEDGETLVGVYAFTPEEEL